MRGEPLTVDDFTRLLPALDRPIPPTLDEWCEAFKVLHAEELAQAVHRVQTATARVLIEEAEERWACPVGQGSSVVLRVPSKYGQRVTDAATSGAAQMRERAGEAHVGRPASVVLAEEEAAQNEYDRVYRERADFYLQQYGRWRR